LKVLIKILNISLAKQEKTKEEKTKEINLKGSHQIINISLAKKKIF